MLDIGLPDMDGYETARRIRELPGGREARIVAASGYGEVAGAAREAGMDAYLVKAAAARAAAASPLAQPGFGASWQLGVERMMASSSSVMSAGMSAKSGVER